MRHTDFVHLHLHSQYSLLDAATRVTDIVRQAHAFKMPAVALTDHGNLFGAIEFYKAARKAGVKPIIGCEVYVAPASRFEKNAKGIDEASYHMVLLARSEKGYRNLIKLVTAGYLEGFYYRPRIDKEILSAHAEGLIGLSACLGGEIPTNLAAGRFDEAVRLAGAYQDILGKGNFYLELQDNGAEGQGLVNREMVRLARAEGLPLVATNDCHYLTRADAHPHDCLICIGTGKTVGEKNRLKYPGDQFYFKSADEMRTVFGEVEEALRNTVEIAERCNVEIPMGDHHLPTYQVPPGTTRDEYLTDLARTGLEDRLRQRRPHAPPDQYWSRLDFELSVIRKMAFSGYFLIVWDFIRYAKEKKIPVGPGRGSAAGSLVAYALGITDIDPLAYGLLFERFLNPDRISLPDIDIDFCQDRRDEVIRYVTGKYGADHVCQIITFGQMKAKAVIRDVARVLGLSYGEADRIAKLIPPTLDMTLDKAIVQEPRLADMMKSDPRVQDLFDIARRLEGLSRHASTHAAGIVISREPLSDHVPLYKGTKDGDEVVTQYSMRCVEDIGLLKVDFLGLRTLTVMNQAVQLVNAPTAIPGVDRRDARDSPAFSLEDIRLDDAETYALLSAARTRGIFQLESAGMRDLLIKMKPSAFEDIIHLVALYRPGPIESGMTDDFIKRRKGATKIAYDLPQLEEILKETYGVIVYQEQVMQIAKVLANYSPGEADVLRKAMGKKDPEVMAEQRKRFVEGALANRIPEKKAAKIFDLMEKFAGYGFNKSHSAAYALLAYQTAYLKAHHPVEFMAALLTSDMGNTDKVVNYIGECKAMGIAVLPPDVNESGASFTPVAGGIRFGLTAVKNVGDGAVESIIAARTDGSPFASLFDFCRRVDSAKVNRRVIESLIDCGAFDFTGAGRARLAAAIDAAASDAARFVQARDQGQASLFDFAPSGAPETSAAAPPLPDVPPWTEAETLKREKESLGLYVSGHPLSRYAEELARGATVRTSDLESVQDGKEITICGIVSALKERTAKKTGEKMATFSIEDLEGSVDAIVFPELYRQAGHLLAADAPLLVTGQVAREENGIKIRASGVKEFSGSTRRNTARIDIRIRATGTTADELARLRDILKRHRGTCPVFLHILQPSETRAVIAAGEDLAAVPSDPLVSDIESLLGNGSVSFA